LGRPVKPAGHPPVDAQSGRPHLATIAARPPARTGSEGPSDSAMIGPLNGGRRGVLAKDALAGKVAVVTGGGTGIGVGSWGSLAGAGARVVISPNANVAGAERTAARLAEGGAESLVRACDVRDYGQVQALFDAALERFGRVDILINNAGITEPHSLLEMTPDEWDRTLNVNLRGMFFCTQRAAKEMIRQGSGGRIVNLSS